MTTLDSDSSATVVKNRVLPSLGEWLQEANKKNDELARVAFANIGGKKRRRGKGYRRNIRLMRMYDSGVENNRNAKGPE